MYKPCYLNELFIKHNKELKRFALQRADNQYDAEDIVQDAFIKLASRRKHEPITNPRAFLFKTVQNLSLNAIRHSPRQPLYKDSTSFDTLTPSLEQEISALQDIAEISRQLSYLPKKSKTIFLMHRLDTKTYLEIGDELGISKNAVKKHIVKTLKKLNVSRI